MPEVNALRDQGAGLDRLQEIATLRVRQGRRFVPTAELQLAPVLRALAARLPGAKAGMMVVPELVGPAGLPDLVAVRLTVALQARIALSVPALLSEADARLVSACWARRPLAVETLARRAELPEPTALRRIRRLEQVGALTAFGTGWVRAAELSPVGRLYALEAKMRDWQAGIAQALRYGGWADASAAVLDRLPRDQQGAIEQARRVGVGLALRDRWLVPPRVHNLPPARRLWASEHLVAALRGEQLSGCGPVQSPSAIA